MKKYSRYVQGKFIPKNSEKYKGTFPIIFRSSYEKAFMQWVDLNQNCVSWGSESAVVKYFYPIDKKNHRYFIDFTATFKNRDGILTKYYIEIKPFRGTQKPIQSKRKKKETFIKECHTYIRNKAKWESATKFAKRKNAKFIILTEKDLFKN